MNADQLGRIVSAVLSALENSNIIKTLGAFNSAFDNLINQSNEENQNNFNNRRNELRTSLNHEAFQTIPNTWRPALEELGIYRLLGSQFEARIDDLIEKNQLTPVVARDEIKMATQSLGEYKSSLEGIRSAFKVLNLGEPTIGPDDGELSVLMPRAMYDSSLKKFSKELKELDELVSWLSEIAGGRSYNSKIKELSTTEPWVLITAIGSAVLLCLTIVDKIQNIRMNQLKLRELAAGAQIAGATKKVRDAIQDNLESNTDKELNDILTWIFNSYTVLETHRSTELRNRMEIKLKWLASRLDNGYQFDGDVEERPGDQPGDHSTPQLVLKVREVSTRIKFLKSPQNPVLMLPQGGGDEANGNAQQGTVSQQEGAKRAPGKRAPGKRGRPGGRGA